MATLLITGGAGFIGSNLVQHALDHTSDRLVVVDKLTYAGSLLNLEAPLQDPRVTFVEATSPTATRWRACSRSAAGRGAQPRGRDARRSVDRRPAPFIDTNIVGTFVLLEAARRHRRGARRRRRARAFRFLHVSTDEVYGTLGASGLVQRGDAVRAELAVRGEQGGGGSPGPRVLPHLRAAGADHELLEQLRAVSVSREADSADDPERARRAAAADLRRRRQRSRLAARRGSLRGHPARARARAGSGEKYNIGGGNERTNLEIVDRICDALDDAAADGAASRRALKTFVPDRPGHDRRYAIDATKIRRELGWAPRHTFERACARRSAGTSTTATGASRCRPGATIASGSGSGNATAHHEGTKSRRNDVYEIVVSS